MKAKTTKTKTTQAPVPGFPNRILRQVYIFGGWRDAEQQAPVPGFPNRILRQVYIFGGWRDA